MTALKVVNWAWIWSGMQEVCTISIHVGNGPDTHVHFGPGPGPSLPIAMHQTNNHFVAAIDI